MTHTRFERLPPSLKCPPVIFVPTSESPTTVHAIDTYIESNKDRFLSELLDLLRIPSVSADPKYKADVARCAEAVKQRMVEAGLDKVEVCPTAGHPIVYGEKIIDPATTMYNPLILWTFGTAAPSSR
jgi:hypothetical protein